MGQCCPPKEIDLILCKSLKKDVCLTFGSPVFNLSGSRVPGLSQGYLWPFEVQFNDFDNFSIATAGGTITTEDNSRVVLTGLTYFMRYRMGTMASSPTFRLEAEVQEDGSVAFVDSKTIDNGCDNVDDTFEGELAATIDFQMDTISTFTIAAKLVTGSVTEACAGNPDIVDMLARGYILTETKTQPTLNAYDETKLEVTF